MNLNKGVERAWSEGAFRGEGAEEGMERRGCNMDMDIDL